MFEEEGSRLVIEREATCDWTTKKIYVADEAFWLACHGAIIRGVKHDGQVSTRYMICDGLWMEVLGNGHYETNPLFINYGPNRYSISGDQGHPSELSAAMGQKLIEMGGVVQVDRVSEGRPLNDLPYYYRFEGGDLQLRTARSEWRQAGAVNSLEDVQRVLSEDEGVCCRIRATENPTRTTESQIKEIYANADREFLKKADEGIRSCGVDEFAEFAEMVRRMHDEAAEAQMSEQGCVDDLSGMRVVIEDECCGEPNANGRVWPFYEGEKWVMKEVDYDAFEAETRAHQQRVAELLMAVAKELLDRAATHDESKLEEPERETFARVTSMLEGMEYGSDEYNACMETMQVVLDHHYKNNSHHPKMHLNSVQGMGMVDLLEMLCDWYAATERHDDDRDIWDSLEHNEERFDIPRPLMQVLILTAKHLERMDPRRTGEGQTPTKEAK